MTTRIINRGRGPEIEGTRITIYRIMDFVRDNCSMTTIANELDLSEAQVHAALDYIATNRSDVEAAYDQLWWVGARRVTLRHVSSRPPLRTVLKAFTLHGSAPSVHSPRKASRSVPSHFLSIHRTILGGQLARALSTFVPVFPKAKGLRHQSSSWCGRLSRPQTTTPFPPLPLHLGSRLGHRPFGERSPLSYFPSTFASLRELPVFNKQDSNGML